MWNTTLNPKPVMFCSGLENFVSKLYFYSHYAYYVYYVYSLMKTQDLQGITNHFDVKSVQEYSSKVEKLGGKVITPKTPVPGVGYFAICKDTENNTFSIFEPDSTVK